ncbi:SDR family NAD(P)-dependent oxidoreductase, partial [Streptomyces sp. NPDC127133]
HAHCTGTTVNWTTTFHNTNAHHIDLPTYAFQRERHWLEPPLGGRSDGGAERGLSHPLLSSRSFVPGQPSKDVFNGRFDLDGFTWILDHKVGDEHLLPGAVWLDLIMTVGNALKVSCVERLDILRPMALAPSDSVEFVITCTPEPASSSHTVEVYAKTSPDDGGSGWNLYCEGTLRDGRPDTVMSQAIAADAAHQQDTATLPVNDFYARLDRMGYKYGSHFREVRQVSTSPDMVCATVGETNAPDDADLYTVYPPYLDAVLQTGTLTEVFEQGTGAARVPYRFENWDIPSYCDSPISVETRQIDAEAFTVGCSGADGSSVSFGGCVRTQEFNSSGLQSYQEGIFTLRYLPQGDSPVDEIIAVADQLKAVGTNWVDEGERSFPQVIVVDCPIVAGAEDVLDLSLSTQVTQKLQEILADPAYEEGSVCVRLVHPRSTPYEAPQFSELPLAAVRGLVRSAMLEYPGRITLTSCDHSAAGIPYHVTPNSESQFNAGKSHPLAVQALGSQSLKIDVFEDSGWSVEPGEWRDCTSFAVQARGRDDLDVGPCDVLISVRAAGVNFRDSLISMDAYPDKDARLGSEAAGVVVQVGDEVEGIAVGDRVAGFFSSSFSQYAKADERLVTKIPDGWSFAQAAAVPVTYCTAYYGLFDLAHAQPGESVLIHSAAGGVGKAAVEIGRMIGLEIFATASPEKWSALEESGIPGERISSSRNVDFGAKFKAVRNGDLDIAIGALSGDLNDVTFSLLGESGRMVEMGKLDLREDRLNDPRYLPFDLFDAGVDRVGSILRGVFELLASGDLGRPGFRGHDVRSLPSLMPRIRDGKTVGKQVLIVPRRLDGKSTVLVTGGLGNAGSTIAEHLVRRYGIRRLVLTTRSSVTSARAEKVRSKLTALGAQIDIRQCDVSDAEAVAQLVEELTSGNELAGVVHCAGATSDRTFDTIDASSFEGVFGVKAGGAWHLHQALDSYDLSFFVLFSSIAGALGTAGQANYAAANSFVDGLSEARVAAGLPSLSIAWGLWADRSGLTSRMSDVDHARLARLGIGSVTRDAALEMFDDALAQGLPNVIAGKFGFADASSPSIADGIHPVLQTLFGPVRHSGHMASSPESAIEENAVEQRRADVTPQPLDAVLGEVARLLGYSGVRGIDPDSKFRQLGLDSLSAVELRNGLRRTLSFNVPTTAIFDHPTPRRLAQYLDVQLAPAPQDCIADAFQVLERELAGMGPAEIAETLQKISDNGTASGQFIKRVLGLPGIFQSDSGEQVLAVDNLNDDELMRIIDNDF